MPSFRYAATAVFWGATVAYIGFGIVGVVFGPIELASLVPHDATTYSQLRFLKACELAVGVSFWGLRHRVHHDAFAQRFVLFALTVTPLARIVAIVADGAPIALFNVIAALEIIGAVVFASWVFETRRALAAS